MLRQSLTLQVGNGSLWLIGWLLLTAVGLVGLMQCLLRPQRARSWFTVAFGVTLAAGFFGMTRFALSAGTWVSLAVVLVATALISLLLNFERQLVRPAVGWTLFTLRMLVLFAFALTLLRPTLAWERDRDRSGRILVAIDVSESTAVTDQHAGPAEKLRWARGLGFIGNESTNARLDRWQSAWDDGREPEWVAADEATTPQQRQELETARRENLQQVFARVDELSRREIARRLLEDGPTALLPQLAEIGEVELMLFAGDATTAGEEDLAEQLAAPPATLASDITNLSRGLFPVNADADRPLMGVVIFTDGHDTAGQDVLAEANRLGNLQAPAVSVLLGSERSPRDLSIIRIDYPQLSYPKDTRLVTAVLGTAGFVGETITVKFQPPGRDPVVKEITPTSDRTNVEFRFEEETLGRHELELIINAAPGETRVDNNQRSFAMTIVDDRVRVVLLDGEARWEFRYLHNAFSRDEGVGRDQVYPVVFRQPYIGVLPDTWFPRNFTTDEAAADNRSQPPLSEIDLLIVGDVSPADMTEDKWAAVERFVTEDGGTLVLTAGQREFPLAHRSAILSRLLPVDKVQPVDLPGIKLVGPPTQRGFRWQWTADGQREPMFRLGGADVADHQQVWAQLPGHTWGLAGEAKPQASVFVTPTLETTAPLSLLQERQRGLVVQQYAGLGQVLWIGVPDTWRWRHRVGDEYHHRFWGQLARWAARNKAAAGNEFVRFTVPNLEVEAGADVSLQARFVQRYLQQHPDVEAKAVFTRRDEPGKVFSEVPLQPLPDRPLIHEGQALALPAGVYDVRLALSTGDPGGDALTMPLYVNERLSKELADIRAQRELLQQIADRSGGAVLTPDKVQEIRDRLVPPEDQKAERGDDELWDIWPMLLAFMVLLTGEWVVRKLNGLP